MSQLSAHAGTRRKVRIERSRPCHRLLNGYALDRANGLALIHPFDDFEPDSVPIEDITLVEMSTPYLTRFGKYVR